MKRILFIFLLCTIFGASQAQIIRASANARAIVDADVDITTGLVAYWACENTTDAIGANEATNTGVTYAAGKVSNCWVYDGGTDVMTLSTTNDLNLQEITISLWFQTNYYYSFFTNTATAKGWTLELNGNTKVKFVFNQSPYPAVYSNSDLRSTTVWHHCVITYDGTTIKMYIDGTLQTDTETFTTDISYTGVVPLIGDGATGNLVGKLDEISVYNYAITQAAVTKIYNSGNAITYPTNY